jgi:hypothetical protein
MVDDTHTDVSWFSRQRRKPKQRAKAKWIPAFAGMTTAGAFTAILKREMDSREEWIPAFAGMTEDLIPAFAETTAQERIPPSARATNAKLPSNN